MNIDIPFKELMLASAIVPVVVTGIVLLFVVRMLLRVRTSGGFGMTRAKQEQAQQLLAFGSKGRGWITSIRPTGMILNHINLECDVGFRIEPLAGGPCHDVSKRMFLAQTAMPRIGDCWPTWFDPADPATFAVGQPTEISADQAAVFKEFGIPNPFAVPPATPA